MQVDRKSLRNADGPFRSAPSSRMHILGIAEFVPYETAPSHLGSAGARSMRSHAGRDCMSIPQGPRRRDDPRCQILRNVWVQLPSQSAIQR